MTLRLLLLPLLLATAFARTARAELQQVPPPISGSTCDDLDPAALATGLDTVIAVMQKKSGGMSIGGTTVSYKDYAARTLAPLAALARKGKPALCAALPTRFSFWRNPGSAPGKFTAYQNPVIHASRTKKGAYQYPLFRRPPGALASLTTAEIFAGGLAGKGLELIYLADPTEVNLVHVEGSATVLLDDGTTTAVSSDGHNGQPYQNVSKLLVADNKIPKNQVTPLGMTRARKYFQDHPAELWQYWARNPHYVFFREVQGAAARSKFGELVAQRSVAVDPAFIPMGVAVWMRTEKPVIADNKVASWQSFGRVALAQDTGSGIRGAGRVDVYYGSGDYAMAASAVTERHGEIYVLLAK